MKCLRGENESGVDGAEVVRWMRALKVLPLLLAGRLPGKPAARSVNVDVSGNGFRDHFERLPASDSIHGSSTKIPGSRGFSVYTHRTNSSTGGRGRSARRGNQQRIYSHVPPLAMAWWRDGPA